MAVFTTIKVEQTASLLVLMIHMTIPLNKNESLRIRGMEGKIV